jgi:hypothetical protein
MSGIDDSTVIKCSMADVRRFQTMVENMKRENAALRLELDANREGIAFAQELNRELSVSRQRIFTLEEEKESLMWRLHETTSLLKRLEEQHRTMAHRLMVASSYN